jgi:hypothetical protein
MLPSAFSVVKTSAGRKPTRVSEERKEVCLRRSPSSTASYGNSKMRSREVRQEMGEIGGTGIWCARMERCCKVFKGGELEVKADVESVEDKQEKKREGEEISITQERSCQSRKSSEKASIMVG